MFNKRILSFIPYKRVVVSTSLNLDDAVILFSDSISPIYDPIWQSPPSKIEKLQGDVTKGGFRIRPTSFYRGSVTYVSGRFIPARGGVNIEMHAYPSAVPCIMVLSGIIVLTAAIISMQSSDNYFLLIWGFVATVIFTIGYIAELDSLDWHIANLIGLYVVESKE